MLIDMKHISKILLCVIIFSACSGTADKPNILFVMSNTPFPFFQEYSKGSDLPPVNVPPA